MLIKFKGDLAEWTSVSDNNFVLNGAKNITFQIDVPFNAKQGNYTGQVWVFLKEI